MGCCKSAPSTSVQAVTSTSVIDPGQKRDVKFGGKTEKDYTSGAETTPDVDPENAVPKINAKHTSNSHSDLPSPSSELDLTSNPTIENYMMSPEMKLKKSQIEEEEQALEQRKHDVFDAQVKQQQGSKFAGLYEIFNEYATVGDDDNKVLNISGFTEALKLFGMIIDTNKTFTNNVWIKFLVAENDHPKPVSMDYGDFAAGMAALIAVKPKTDPIGAEQALSLLFEIFDNKESGYLDVEDMARILLSLNQIAIIVTGRKEEKNQVIYTKKQCIKQARKMVAEFDSDQFTDNKISYDEFKKMMFNRTEDQMMLSHMVAPSISMAGVENELDFAIAHYTPNQQRLTIPGHD